MKRMHSQRGSSIVEFAFAATVLLLVSFGVIEFGRMLYVYHTVANAARIGSRWAMVRGSNSCVYPVGKQLATCPATEPEVQSYVQSQVPILDQGPLTVKVTWSGGNLGCTSTTDFHAAGCEVIVDASHTFKFDIPFVSSASLPITSSSHMIISQ